jgi:Na+/melibiose symporter-like transporter
MGFNPRGENSETAVMGLSVVFVAVPVICNILVSAIMWKFPIGVEEQRELRRKLEERYVEELETGERPPFA